MYGIVYGVGRSVRWRESSESITYSRGIVNGYDVQSTNKTEKNYGRKMWNDQLLTRVTLLYTKALVFVTYMGETRFLLY